MSGKSVCNKCSSDQNGDVLMDVEANVKHKGKRTKIVAKWVKRANP
jgi:hypothetical protein